MLRNLSKNLPKRVPWRAQNPPKMRLNFDVQNLMGCGWLRWWYGGGVGLPGVALQARTLGSPGEGFHTAGIWRCAGSRGLRPTPPPRLAAQSGLEMCNKIEEKTSNIDPRSHPGAPKIMKNVSCEAPRGNLGGPWAAQGGPGRKKDVILGLSPPLPGDHFLMFF